MAPLLHDKIYIPDLIVEIFIVVDVIFGFTCTVISNLPVISDNVICEDVDESGKLMVILCDAGFGNGASPAVNTNPLSDVVPDGDVTETFPEAPPPTTATMSESEMTANELAAVPPKFTDVTPVKLVPLIATAVPVFPFVGVNAWIVAGGDAVINTKPLSESILLLVSTYTYPLSPAPTVALITESETIVNNVAGILPKRTDVVLVK